MAECLDDLNLPTAMIARLIKDALPQGVSVTAEAKAAIARAASVFVLYLTNMSNSKAKQDNRKRIIPRDIFDTVRETNFEEFLLPLQEAFDKYKKIQTSKKAQKKDSNVSKDNGKEEDDGDEQSERSDDNTL